MDEPALRIDDDVFGDAVPGDPTSGQSEGFILRTRETQGAIEAIQRAGPRIMLTRADGHEFSSAAELDEYLSTPTEPYHLPTPSWVSDVHEVPQGLAVVFDACATISPAMAETLSLILRQELLHAGVVSARITKLDNDEMGAVVARMPGLTDGR